MAALLFNLVRPRKPRTYRLQTTLFDDYNDNELRARYRFGRESILYITQLISNDLERKTRRGHALRPVDQVLIALRFYASGSFLQVIGDTFGVDKGTVSRVVTNVSRALAAKQSEFIKWPNNPDKLKNIKSEFFKLGGFPGVVGCVNGSQIRIQTPYENEKSFVNRKSYHSINVQGICNHEGMLTNIVARWPGSTHDSFIFRNSNIFDYLEQNYKSLEDGLLLGDSGYACSPYLMTPFSNPQTRSEDSFNKSLCKTRVTIEQTFGRLKRRFHVLHSEIRMHPEKVCVIIGACGVLHNIAIMRNEPMEDGDDEDDDNPEVDPYHGPQRGLAVRTHICNTFFG